MPSPRATISDIVPFQLGPGSMPPLLAGREQEKKRLRRLYRYLSAGRPSDAPAVLTGPRGNGKTVMMQWLKQKIEAKGIDTLWLTPKTIPTVEALAGKLGQKPWRSIEKISGGLGAAGAEVKGEVQWGKPPPSIPPDLAALICKRAEKRPFAMLIDEAHTLDTDVGAALLNAEQEAKVGGAPFLLALAGTPDLPDALDQMDITFWSRSEKLGMKLLEEGDAQDSLKRPMADADLHLEDPHLWDEIVADSQGYPYFLQIWGVRLWDQAIGRECPARLTREDVETARAEVNTDRTAYYARRCDELLNDDLLAPALAVAGLFENGARAASRKITRKILVEAAASAVGKERAKGAVTRLAHLGFVWNEPGERFWAPGIPSLMDYVREQEGAPAPQGGSPRP